MPKKSPAQVRRMIKDNAELVHEFELMLGGYEGRVCKDRPETEKALAKAKVRGRELRDLLDDAIAAERKFMKKR